MRSLLLVVDTSVMQAAGETQHPTSSACRLCLEWILRICHRVLVPPDLTAEWRDHQGRRARRWQVEMRSRRKRLTGQASGGSPLPLDLARFEPKPREAVEKDLMLLEAAWQADKVIVTLDKNLRTALETTREGADLARRIRWIDPLTTSEDELRNLRPGS